LTATRNAAPSISNASGRGCALVCLSDRAADAHTLINEHHKLLARAPMRFL
jgi:hypothetical protein